MTTEPNIYKKLWWDIDYRVRSVGIIVFYFYVLYKFIPVFHEWIFIPSLVLLYHLVPYGNKKPPHEEEPWDELDRGKK